MFRLRPKPPPVPCGCGARLPDFLQFQLDFYVGSVAAAYTNTGDVFIGGGFNRGYPNPVSIGVSIADGWLIQCAPTQDQTNTYLRGFSWGGSGYWGFGGGLNHNSSGTAITLGVGAGVAVGGIGNKQLGNIAGGQ
jgi:filamentous hemagglutinin